MSRRARSVTFPISICLLFVALAFARAHPQRPGNLTGVWTLDMRSMPGDSDTAAYRGTIVLVAYRQDSAPWSFNMRRPDYVGAYDFPGPRSTYVSPTLMQFPAVAARWVSSDSVMLALGPQNADHGWLSLSGQMKGDAICGSWALAAYAIKHRGNYCMRRLSN
jgi:hypothetical protein